MVLDIATIATAGSALATVTLAFATFWLARTANQTLKEEKEQLRVLTYQASAIRSQTDPLLKLHRWYFKGNKLSVDLENLGTGRAFWLGIYSWFNPSALHVSETKDGPRLTDTEIQRLAAKGVTTTWARATGRLDNERRLTFRDRKDVTASSAVNFMFNNRLGGESILDPAERQTFDVEPHFEIKPRKGGPLRPSWSWPLDFDQTKEFLQTNRAEFAVLGFRIVCRNSVGDTVYGESFGHLVMFVREDSSLEDVMKRAFAHSLVALGEREFPSIKYMDWELYNEGKFIKPPEKQPEL